LFFQSLAAHGADCAAVDADGNNGMHFAAEGGFAMICKFLAQRGNACIIKHWTMFYFMQAAKFLSTIFGNQLLAATASRLSCESPDFFINLLFSS